MSGERSLIGAVDIGGTKIAAGLVDKTGQILDQEIGPTAAERSLDDGLERIFNMIQACLKRTGMRADGLKGIGIGCTGPVDPETGVLGPNSFMPGWEGVGLVERLERLFGLPVAIENDADAAALGEYAWGAGKGASRFLYLTVSTGIGCGIVLDGGLYRGVNGAHPEMGHHVIEATVGPVCFCGARGCWESLASGPALAEWYGAEARTRRLPVGEGVDAREVCRRAASGDLLAREAVEREGFYLGLGLANLITLFTPDVMVLGGGLMASWPLFEGRVREAIRLNCRLVPYQYTDLRLASLGERTGLAGAARVWIHRYENQKP